MLAKILIGIGVVVAVTSVILFVVATSLWLMWYGLPAGEQRAVLSVAIMSRLGLTTLPADLLPEEVQVLLPQLTAVGVSRTGSQATVILRPRLTRQVVVGEQLARQGWTVQRHGLLLVAHQGLATPRPLFSSLTLAPMFRTIALSHYPVRPSLIFESERLPYLQEPLSGVMTLRRGSLRLLTLTPGASIESSPLPLQPAVNSDAVLHVPGELLAHLPLQLKQRWNETLRTKLAFALTRPEFIQTLAQAQTVRLSFTGDNVGMAVYQHPTFKEVATQWLEAEERHTRLVQRAFRLPDGTLGYEKVPGEPQAVSRQQPDSPCLAPIAGKSTLWVCEEGGVTALATSEAAGRALVGTVDTYHEVSIGADLLRKLTGECSTAGEVSWCGLLSFVFEQRAGRAAVHVTIK